jgi:hypothetical protein
LLIKDAGGAILDSALTHDITVTSDKNIQTLPGTNIKMMVSVVSYEINDPPVKGGPVPVLPPEKPPRDLEPIKDAPIEQPGNGVGPAPEDPSRNDQNVRSDAEVIKLIAIRDEKASQRAGVPPGVKIVGEVKRNNEERMPAKE